MDQLCKRKHLAMDVLLAAIDGDYDVWRKYYDELTFSDLVWINTGLHYYICEQNRGSYWEIESVLNYIIGIKNRISIVELGCNRGFLASSILRCFGENISNYIGYDANHSAVDETFLIPNDKYKAIKCTDWFWNYPICADVFISTHTLEHFSNQQIKFIIDYLKYSKIDHIILEMPFLRSNQNWIGRHNSHVSDISLDMLINLAEKAGYSMVKNTLTSEDKDEYYYDVYLMVWRRNEKYTIA